MATKPFQFVKSIYTFFSPQPKNLKEYGSWAILLTGSGSGSTTGKDLACELARKGLNILLVGSSPSPLESTSNEIRKIVEEEIDIKTTIVNLNKSSGEEIMRRIKGTIKGLDIGIVVNYAADPLNSQKKIFGTIDWEVMQSRMGRRNMDTAEANIVINAVMPILVGKKRGAILSVEPGASHTFIINYLVYQKDTSLRYVEFCDNKDQFFEIPYDAEQRKSPAAIQEVGVGVVLKAERDKKETEAAIIEDVLEKVYNIISERLKKCQQKLPHLDEESWELLEEFKKDEELTLRLLQGK